MKKMTPYPAGRGASIGDQGKGPGSRGKSGEGKGAKAKKGKPVVSCEQAYHPSWRWVANWLGSPCEQDLDFASRFVSEDEQVGGSCPTYGRHVVVGYVKDGFTPAERQEWQGYWKRMT